MAGKGGARPGRRTRGPHLIRRGLRWYAYIGRGDVRSLNTEDESVAREQFREIVAKRPTKAARFTASLDDIAKAYKAAPHGWTKAGGRTEKQRADCFVEAMAERGVTLPANVTTRALDAWRTARMAKVSRATIARDEACAGRMMAWAVERKMAAANPFAEREAIRAPSRPKRRVIHSPAQVSRMVAWALDNDQRGWALTCATLEALGFRIEEARRMDPAWVRADGVELKPEAGAADTAWESKGFKPRMVHLGDESLAAIREFLTWRDTPHGKRKMTGISDRWFVKLADRAAKELEMPQTYRPHDSRRRWVTEMLRAGHPIADVCDLVGHANVATTERYVCSYYDDPVAVRARTSAAVAALARPAGNVLPLRRKGGAE